jgi:predicted DNA binding CopG/RHH family protein
VKAQDFDTAFGPLTRESEPKSGRVNMRLSQPLVDAVEARAAEGGIPYQRLIREEIERAVRRWPPPLRGSGRDARSGP